MSVPRSGKKSRTTYEAAAASVPRSRQSSGSQPEAVQSAFISSRSGHNPFTSQGAGTYRKAAAPGVPDPRGSGPLCSGRGGAEVPSYEYEYQAPPGSHSRPSAPPARSLQGTEVDRLRQHVLVLEIALGLGTGGDAAAQAGNQGVHARFAERLDRLQRDISDLHGRVDRRAFSSDLDEAFRQIRRVESLQPRLEPPLARSQPYAYGAYPAYSAYAPGVRSYGAPPAYDLACGLDVQREPWTHASATTSEAAPRFEELDQGGSASQQPPADHGTA
ncbi:hypothetical protein PPTG_19702 [Phytophthora nicotianae INRA-310]|uniref:Uncharacterized protein n=1 Tax=Phytophthora nicotianae (strain INRA-310) TaxID=761204 RepID=W2PB68_PHYN3|nr:hypothetical protein PPTG_19702 [Phytophthora nicotianae INRA-310]ETM98272.1 hypothetical protein PPTG_19702 [Phytophthora nicotianae INRA-310]